MALDSGLYTYLQTVAGVTSLVSTRIYPHRLPQGVTLPAVVYMTADEEHEESLGGSSGLSAEDIELDVYASTFLSSKAVAEALRQALQGYVGTMGTVEVQAVHLLSVETIDQSRADKEIEEYLTSLTFRFWHCVSKPTF